MKVLFFISVTPRGMETDVTLLLYANIESESPLTAYPSIDSGMITLVSVPKYLYASIVLFESFK